MHQKLKQLKRITTFFAFLFIVVAAPSAHATIKDGKLECPVLRPIAQGFLTHHVEARKLDAEHEKRTIEQFINRLDPSKTYLMESDADEIRATLQGIFNRLGEDCTGIEKAHTILDKRLDEAAVYAKSLLGDSFKFQPETELMLDPKLRKFSTTKTEWEDQMGKFIQFQISNYLASDMKLPQAKKQLIHRYELNAKRQGDLKRDDLYALFLDAFASALDAHSSYMAADSLEDFDIQMKLSLEGIGAALTWEDGYTTVENLIPGGSAERQGELKPKDKIIAVAQGKSAFEHVIDMPLRDVVKLIRGKKGTTVRLTILRQEKNSQRHKIISIVRDKVKLEDDAARLTMTTKKVDGKEYKIAIINLPSFYGDMTRRTRSCYDDTKKALEEAIKQKADGVVFDLSNNGGGLLTEAVRIGGLFIKKGNIVATKDSHDKIEPLADDDDNLVYKGPLVVLTSRLSASASEIVSGALQDYHRAVIVGSDQTFGKGTVQAMMNLPSNLGAIKVTTGMFFVPGGQSTQYRGVPADVVIPSPFSTKEIGEVALEYSLKPAKIDAFLSPDANSQGADHWDPVDSDLIAKLKAKSAARVEKDPEFKKITQELIDNEKKKGVIKLADSLKRQKEEKADPKNKNKSAHRGKRQTDEDYLKLPQIGEAVSVMGDMLEATATGGAQANAK